MTNLRQNLVPGIALLLTALPVAEAFRVLVQPSQAQQPAAAVSPSPAQIALPGFELVTNLESPPKPTKALPARPGRVFDGPVTRDGAVAAWKGGSVVAFYDYGVNCNIKAEPSCAALGVATAPDPSGFSDERTVADPADPQFIQKFGQRVGAMLDQLKPRPRDLLAAHIDNLGLVFDGMALRLIYAAARAEYERRQLRPLFVIKNNMRGHEPLLQDGALRPEEVAYIICENCLTKGGGAELEAGIRLAGTYTRPLILIEFGKAKMSWQDATLVQVEGLAQRLRDENLRGFAFWGPNEDRYEFTRQFPGAPEAQAKN